MTIVRTLVDLARDRAQSHPTRGYRFLREDLAISEEITYGELDRSARKLASTLSRFGFRRGDRALLVYPYGLAFVRAFWACLYAGVIAVPAPPPVPLRQARTVGRLRAIAEDCKPTAILTSSTLLPGARAALESASAWKTEGLLGMLSTDDDDDDDDDDDEPSEWRDAFAESSDVAIIQYTSGSTSIPRGVELTHANLLHNLDMLRSFHLHQRDMVMLHWLPLYHDMGLVRGMLSPLHMGGDCFMMSPLSFIQSPTRWLSALTRHAATTTGAPNFGFEICARKVSDEEIARLHLDLKSVRVAFCTAEPIQKATVERFIERFARCGFQRSSFRPAYGLAEATVMVSGELRAEGMRSLRLSKKALREDRVVILDEHGDESDRRDVVCCGRSLREDQEVCIVDHRDGRRCQTDHVGEIWIRGPSVGRGYWGNPSMSEQTFGARLADGSGPYLRTGDLGFLAPDDDGGELFITGRLKDLVIVRGENHYAHDIEWTVEASSRLIRPGCTAAFGVEVDGSEAVVILCEQIDADCSWNDACSDIVRAVGETHGIGVHAICFIAQGHVPKTASGKVQRSLARELYETKRLKVLYSWTTTAEEPP
jgi:acyl-CoA synthetase (AMP-forming)/AMP-acid ligase II